MISYLTYSIYDKDIFRSTTCTKRSMLYSNPFVVGGKETYSQINVLRRDCLLKLHLVFGRLSRVVILQAPDVDRFRRMPNIVTRALEGRMRSRTFLGRFDARSADVSRSFAANISFAIY